ncbi:MAG TPA: hypothetical protein DDW68_05055 [Verrucomicrobiales bacterium]|nr:hypothetical protein [Verrucomicrobiales bacterium]HBE96521.1 hypothetical protein [Verrucomicrobiales bacterium]
MTRGVGLFAPVDKPRDTAAPFLSGIGGGDTLEAGTRRNIGEEVCRATKDHEDQEGKNHQHEIFHKGRLRGSLWKSTKKPRLYGKAGVLKAGWL